MKLLRPFEIINQTADYDVRGNVTGGGLTGQVGALVHGISKALLQFDENLKPTLKKENLPREILGLLKERNTVIEKLDVVSNFQKDNFSFSITTVIINYAKAKYFSCRLNWLHRYRIGQTLLNTKELKLNTYVATHR